jgi:hypothetical protein
MNPCSTECNAFFIGGLEKIASSCDVNVCKFWVQVAHVANHTFATNDWVALKDVNDDDAWDGDYRVTRPAPNRRHQVQSRGHV